METPRTKAGAATERIMRLFSRCTPEPERVIALETPQYNRVYSKVLEELTALERADRGPGWGR